MMTLLINESNKPMATLVLAHGAGAGKDSDFMQQVAVGIAKQGINVLRFDFPYMQKMHETGKRRPPDKMPVLLESYAAVVEQCRADLPVFIGGKSMGGRVAATLAADTPTLGIKGVVALGYPFHPPGKPEKTRLQPLLDGNKPILVMQGERDTFGKKGEVAQYNLPSHIECDFLQDGDHSFKPPKSSPATQLTNIANCIDRVKQFVEQHG